MKYKYLLILNIFIIQNLSLANDNIDNLCKNFLKSSQNSDVHLNSNKDVLFKAKQAFSNDCLEEEVQNAINRETNLSKSLNNK